MIMTAQGLEVIDHTVHTTHEWVNELAGRLDWTSKRSALRLLRIVLHHVRDHLLIDELAQFSAQLPLLVRGMMFEEWVPKHTPIKERLIGDFDDYFRIQMGDTDEYRGRDDVIKVFHLLNSRISAGEVNDIRASLPSAIREIWPAP
jgi:uncharacterized protein (DUF2267 family)